VLRSLHAVAALAATLAAAPLQCPRPAAPETAREETPGEALWTLAERFDREGNGPARDRTLRFLVERYPSSRFAYAARERLAPHDAAATATPP
jgi:hypothetical protein